MIEDPGLARLPRSFGVGDPTPEFFHRMRARRSDRTQELIEWILEQPSWIAGTRSFLADEAYLLDRGEFAVESAISVGSQICSAPPGEEGWIPWCHEQLIDTVGLCLWRDEERLARHAPPETPGAPPDSLADQLTYAPGDHLLVATTFNTLPAGLRQPLYKLAISNWSLDELLERSGWSEEQVRGRVQRSIMALQSVIQDQGELAR